MTKLYNYVNIHSVRQTVLSDKNPKEITDMDIKEKVEDILKKVKSDKNLKAKFEKDPVKTVEEILGVDLPDELIEKVINAAKTKISGDAAGDIKEKLGGLFDKK